MAESRLQLIIDLANKMFNTKLKDTQDKFNSASNNMMGKAKALKMENAKAFGAMTDQFPALQRGMDLLTNKYVLMAGAAAGIGMLAGKAIKVGVEDEMQRTSFEVLLNGKKAAEGMVADIADYAAKTPYEKLGLGKVAQTMLSFGIAQEKIMPNMKMLGDIAMGDANKLESLGLAFSQISSAGKLQGQDLMQLINAGFNPLAEMSKKTGLSIGQLKEQMEKGNISFAMVEDAFKSATAEGGQFHGMADKMSQTLGGKLSSMSDAFSGALLGVYGVLQPMLIPAIDWLTKVIEGIVPTFQWLVDLWKEGNPVLMTLATIIGAVAGVFVIYNAVSAVAAFRTAWLAKETKLQVFWDKIMQAGIFMKNGALLAYNGIMLVATTLTDKQKLATMGLAAWNGIMKVATLGWTAAQWLLNIALNANPIGLIVLAIAALVGMITLVVAKYDSWGASLTLLMGPLGIIINLVMTFKRNWESITKAFKEGGILAGIKRIGIVLLDMILYPVQQLLGLLAKIPGLSKLASGGQEKIANLRKNLGLADPQSESKKKVSQTTPKKTKGDEKVKQLKKGDKKDEDNTLYANLLNGGGKDGGKKGGSKDSHQGEQVSKVTGAGQQVRNITVNIDSFVKGGINTANTTLQKMDTKEIENWFNEMLLRTVRNLELSNG